MTRTRSQLFMCAFAAQAGFLTLSPILPDVAAEFDSSSAAVGQLRTLSGLIGGLVALYLFARPGAPGLRSILRGSLVAMLTGSLVSAAAPDLVTLAVGQAAIGAASAGLLTAGIAAAARWPAEEQRASVLTWAIVGQPAAWVIGMPLIGVAAEASWRLTWLVLPGAGATIALAMLRNRPPDGSEQRTVAAGSRRPIRGWATSEVLAHAAWGGTLVYAGALLRESYSISAGTTGLVLGIGAATYFAGAFSVGHPRSWRVHLVWVTLILGVGIAIFGFVRPALGFSAVLFGVLVMVAGARTTLATSFVLEIPERERLRAAGSRAAAMQFGYLLGAFTAGAAVAIGGFAAMGFALAGLLLAACVPHVPALRLARRAAAVRDVYTGTFAPRFGSYGPRFTWGWSPEFPDRPQMSDWLSQWREVTVEPRQFVQRGRHLIVLTRFRATGQASGARVDAHGAHLWTFRKGRPVRLEIFSDPALALASAGPCSLDTSMSRLARIPLSCLHRWHATFSTPSALRSSSSTAAWARPSSSSI